VRSLLGLEISSINKFSLSAPECEAKRSGTIWVEIFYCFCLLVIADQFDDPVVVLCPVGKSAACADFDLSAVFLCVAWAAWATLKMIQRAVAEQAVHLFNSFVAGIILAVPVLKKSV
jgi:hypothetical protein